MNTHTVEIDKVKARIHALSRKTVENGCTESEAMSAMSLVGQLLAQYNLTMEEIDVRQSKCKTLHIPINRERRHPAADYCMMGLAYLIDGKCWFSKKWEPVRDAKGNTINHRKRAYYAFFGQEQDLELVEYLFNVIMKAAETETAAFKKTEAYRNASSKKRAFVSFQKGMASRIDDRLRQIKNENDARMAALRSTGTALIVLKGQLIAEEWQQAGITLRPVKVHTSLDYNAYGKGQKAGDKVNLSRPINSGSKVSGLIS